jgi:hypothetical protein
MTNQPNDFIRQGAQNYNLIMGYAPIIEGHYVPAYADFSHATAEAYDALPYYDHASLPAYAQLSYEIELQYAYAVYVLGICFEPWSQEGQPYQNSNEMCMDVRTNKHLWYFTGGEIYPFLGDTNDKFRAIHDLFGHSAEGFQFGPRGEFNAWIHHSMMFSSLAQLALTTETHGQNSWVNYGPYSHLPANERPFAEQKAALLPSQFCNWRQFLR